MQATTLVGQRKLGTLLQSHSDICQKLEGHIQRCNQTDAVHTKTYLTRKTFKLFRGLFVFYLAVFSCVPKNIYLVISIHKSRYIKSIKIILIQRPTFSNGYDVHFI